MLAFAFYLFAITAVVSGTFVIFAKNPVHSVLWLILAFFAAAGLFILMGAEFLAMLLMIVYVGAVAVLFLFVVMMLDVDFAELRGRISEYAPFAMAIGVIVMMQLGIAIVDVPGEGTPAEFHSEIGNVHAIGMVVYTKYVYAFQASGLILLVAMVGAIVLTLRHREGVKKQDVVEQMHRDAAKAVELKDIKPGQGL